MTKIIIVLHGKDGEPDTMEMDGLIDETVIVNFIDGTVKMETREKPTLINADTGEPYPDQDPAGVRACDED